MHKLFLILFFVCSFNLTAQEQKRYEVRSGKIVMSSAVLGIEQKMRVYFDAYGQLERTEVISAYDGNEIQNLQLRKDGYFYNLDMLNKKGEKTKIDEDDLSSHVNFLKLQEDYAGDFKIKKVGAKEYLGKMCEVWTISHDQSSFHAVYYVWQGISLKTDMRVHGLSAKMTTESIDIEIDLDSSIFQIPEGFDISMK